MSDALLSLINGDIEAASTLLQLIDDEYQALQARDLDQLQKLLDGKLPLLQQLEQNGRIRAQALLQAGVSVDREGLAQIAQATGNPLLPARAEELGALLERCQEANQRNGRIIRSGQASTERTLDILRGQDTPRLYDRYGGSTQGNRQRPLSQA
ncbi:MULTISPECIES: flagella synthesis protein FlgN [Pseudomonas]|uniref:Flagellar protein FlgN n=1 Tax=Pseudomonas multiresinivorans TaxID=95301 RepID=A0A7Z3GS23_9PSED|nr:MULTISPECIES: flagellar export chaperone FlgN [Pseudomonas]MCE4069934.1 flagellar export chaperone FlgN [Pseudomonas nitritireducens]MCE4078539.1 flagellar export chaperone FlgN [Pseudomonas nitroreducens]OBY56106.1 flagellar biosynthesis protein FlgN [Pseudomonas sp. AU12215]OBY91447.1 flagellar biosynthesis protein FlgN [Pseudomonas sp. AU11447]QJP10770.1 flagellar protein FlgN [Pseudomonas multiresinivorans]